MCECSGIMDSDDSYPDDDEYYYYNEEEKEEELPLGNVFSPGTYCGFQPSFLIRNCPLPSRPFLTPEEADRNARKLVEEEEREKEKANKKRLKKKRQKDRKRQQKLQEAQNCPPASEEDTGRCPDAADNDGGTLPGGEEEAVQGDCSGSASDDDLDLGSSFVLKAQKKMANKPKPERRERRKEPSRERAKEQPGESVPEGSQERQPAKPPPALQDNVIQMNILDRYKIQESMDLASIGNNMAKSERFAESLHFYTEALKINPSEYRFLGNRSYSYERLAQYREALADAQRALELKPEFLKGYFRKGKALKGLKRYSEAMEAFRQVLLCDDNHVEAAQEISQCQQRLQESIACSRVKILSSAPLSPPTTPPPAAVPGYNPKVFVSRNIYNTKCGTTSIPPTVAATSKLFPVWVGNVTTKITEETLRSIFEPFGSLHSIRILHSRTCAFVNFTRKEAAESAFHRLQGLHVGGTALVLQLRNPDHQKR